MRGRWWLLTLALVVVGTGVLLAVRDDPTVFDPSTPEGTVQAYLEAVLDDDRELAQSFLTADLGESCEGKFFFRGEDESVRAVLGEVKIEADRARVEVELTFSQRSSPFDGYEYDSKEVFRLEPAAGRWLISEIPWPMYECEVMVP